MSWNDGISKEMSDMLEATLSGLEEETKQAAREVIDEETKRFQTYVLTHVPRNTGGLAASFMVYRVNDGKPNWYGYKTAFEGNAPNGVPYEKIANTLNFGRPAGDGYGAIASTEFVSNAVRRLKGMDDRIEARIAAKLAKRTE